MTHPTTPPLVAPETTWHRVPDPDDSPDRARFISWSKVALGTELIGRWRGALEGQYGAYGTIELPTGASQRFGLPTLLARRLALVEPGQDIRITYLGTRAGKGDKSPYHCFEVESRAPIFLPAAPDGPETPDDAVPF